MIELKNIKKAYNSLAGNVEALKGVSLKIHAGENVIIVGKSGSGKSTLLNVISGIDRADQGEIIIGGKSLGKLSENELALWRGRNVGIVFQFYQLIPTLSAIDNVLFAMDLVNKIPKKERKERAALLLDKVSLLGKKNKFINELSGGEKQRIAIARALSNNPAIIIADEPTGNLDSKTSEKVHALFQKLNKDGFTIITVTHENVEKRPANQVIEISDGNIKSIIVKQ